MNESIKKKLIFFSGLLLIISAILAGVSIFYIFIAPEQALASYIEMFELIEADNVVLKYEDLMNFLKNISIIIYCINFGVSIITGVYFITASKYDHYNKKTFIIMNILNIIFVGNIISFILIFIGLFWPADQQHKVINQNDQVVCEIKKIKEMKERGVITKEEYINLLNELIK